MLFKFTSLLWLLNLVNLVISSSFFVDKISDDIQENANSKIWVVLVAGSAGYYNYRHQADVLHAYHLIHNVHHIPKDRIILFMYDDIAYNDNNPLKGNIINYPNGENLYTDDIEKDYTGAEVTPDNFISVLLKDDKLIKQNKKVLNSTSEDRVFIYFTDHGSPAMVAFPTAILSAKRLNKALKAMRESNSFSKLLIYIEACESGSMFINELDPGKNIYALTASSFNEPSYAIFWDETRKTYLADEFSINWILDSYAIDKINDEETIFNQFLNVKNKTKDSTVCEFGDIEMAKKYDTSDFQGRVNVEANFVDVNKLVSNVNRQPIRSDEVEYYLTKIYSDLNKDDSFNQLIKGRNLVNQFMNSLRTKFSKVLNVDKKMLNGRNAIENIDCYDDLLNYFNDNCIPLSVHTYLLRHLYLLVNTCNVIKKTNTNIGVYNLTQIIDNHCLTSKNAFITLPKII